MANRLIVLVALILATTPAVASLDLTADSLDYSSDGVAQAAGSVELKGRGLSLSADWLSWNNVLGMATLEGSPAYLTDGSYHLSLQRGVYNIKTREGSLTDAAFRASAGQGTAYVKADTLQVMPCPVAEKRGFLKKTDAGSGDLCYSGENVSITTDPRPEPAYELKSRQVVYIPEGITWVRRPQLWWHGHYLFTSPFDYRYSAGEKALGSAVLPSLIYQKGNVGLSYGGTLQTALVPVTASAILWWGGDYEVKVGAEKKLGDFSFSATAGYEKNDLAPRGLWRLSARADTVLAGWAVGLQAARNEHYTTLSGNGQELEVRVHRLPQVHITGPWWKLADRSGGVRVWADWGRFAETTEQSLKVMPRSRYGWGLNAFWEHCGRWMKGRSRVWFSGDYESFIYGTAARQNTLTLGLGGSLSSDRWRFQLAAEYRTVSGRSPFRFDRKSDYFKLYPGLGFEVTPQWGVDLQAQYDLTYGKFYWVETLVHLNDGPAAQWRLFYRHPLQNGVDRKVGVQFVLNAFPDTPLEVGQVGMQRQGVRPSGL